MVLLPILNEFEYVEFEIITLPLPFKSVIPELSLFRVNWLLGLPTWASISVPSNLKKVLVFGCKLKVPLLSKTLVGVDVPIPILPSFLTTKLVVPELLTTFNPFVVESLVLPVILKPVLEFQSLSVSIVKLTPLPSVLPLSISIPPPIAVDVDPL